jgi:hypothetical protein
MECVRGNKRGHPPRCTACLDVAKEKVVCSRTWAYNLANMIAKREGRSLEDSRRNRRKAKEMPEQKSNEPVHAKRSISTVVPQSTRSRKSKASMGNAAVTPHTATDDPFPQASALIQILKDILIVIERVQEVSLRRLTDRATRLTDEATRLTDQATLLTNRATHLKGQATLLTDDAHHLTECIEIIKSFSSNLRQ